MAEVIYAKRAVASLTSHFEYINERNPNAGREFVSEIEQTADLLGEFPKLGRAIENLPLRFHITKKFRYRIVYMTKGDRLEIRDVLHPSRNWRR